MIDIFLGDREECIHDGVRCCFEVINVKCPDCGDGTNIVVTYPDYTIYHHDATRSCKVFWTKESVPLGCELAVNLIIMPSYMRE